MAEINKFRNKKWLITSISIASVGGATLAAGGVVAGIKLNKTVPVSFYTIKFDPNSNEAELKGASEVKMSTQTTFEKLNKPEFVTLPSGKLFSKWTTDKEGLNPIEATTLLNSDLTLFAQYVDKATTYTLTFTADGEEGVTLTGPTTVGIEKGQQFSKINVPVAAKADTPSATYEFDYWTTVKGSETGKVIPTTTFTEPKTLYPVFKEKTKEQFVHLTFQPKVEDEGYNITFNGGKTCRISLSNQLKFGECNKPDVAKTKAITTPEGTYTLNYPFLNKWVYLDDAGEYQEVTDDMTFKKEENYIFPVFSSEPTFLESQYYVEIDGELGAIVNNTEYIGDQIEIKFADKTEFYDKTEFNHKIHIGSKITSISPNFLRGCTKYNQEIELPSNVTFIGSGFMFGCTAFNNGGKPFAVPKTITSIGNCFMYGCTSFNQEITFSEGLEIIGDYFMFYCTEFNQTLQLPTTLTTIGDSFMSNCISYNNGQNTFSLPNGLTSIGNGFLEECGEFTQDIDLSKTQITEIQDSFLYNSTKYAGAVTLPTAVTNIGKNFMAWITSGSPTVNLKDCTNLKTIGDALLNNSQNFNQDIDLSACTQLTSIGSNMLRTTNYNKNITFPSSLESLGKYFMYGATSYNTNLTLPTSLTTIGNGFMYGCTGYTSGILTIQTENLAGWEQATESEVDLNFYRYEQWGQQSYYKVKYNGTWSDFTNKFPDSYGSSWYHRRFSQQS